MTKVSKLVARKGDVKAVLTEFGKAFLMEHNLVDAMGDQWVAKSDDKKVVSKEF